MLSRYWLSRRIKKILRNTLNSSSNYNKVYHEIIIYIYIEKCIVNIRKKTRAQHFLL